jgi:hypothetical protein
VPPRLVVVGEVVRFADQFKQQFSGFNLSGDMQASARESVE